jgi:hypothetical protein
MVKYIPELGLVVAASQKGRVAIISLTWQEEVGFGFRLDWIVPFHTQEQKDERPQSPLLGIAVSPMPGFEVPQDVPCIPQGIDPTDWLKFNYHILNPEENDDSSSATSSRPPSPSQKRTTNSAPTSSADFISFADYTASRGHQAYEPNNRHNIDAELDKHNTLPEIHAEAFRVYRPHETWHGYHPSRHYRLFLMYSDHTVMKYEFWHDWDIKAPSDE